MMRLVTITCPNWGAIASGCDPGTPVAVVRANRVVAVSPSAAEAGVGRGLRRREAQARCPDVAIVHHDPDRDARLFEPIVRAVGDLVPLLEITEPGMLTFPSRGPSRYCGGDEALAIRLVGLVHGVLVEQFGEAVAFPALGIADGRFASGVAAHRSVAMNQAVVIPRGHGPTVAFLERFPVGLLRDVAGLPDTLVALLRRLGVTTLGALAELPAADVLARFGPDGVFAHRLSSGHDDRPATTREPPAELNVRQTFDDPVTQIESLVFGARRMAETLYAQLAAEGTVCTRLAVIAETDHGERTERVWYHQTGMRAAAMVERIRWQLDGWVRQPGGLSAGVVLFVLAPLETRADTGRQQGFWGGISEADEWAARAMTRLGGLLGVEQVTVPVWRGGRTLATEYELVPASLFDLDTEEFVQRGETVRPNPAQPWPGALPSPSPAAVAQTPRACSLRDRNGDDIKISGRGLISDEPVTFEVEGRIHQIAAWAGPWPIEQRWWAPNESDRRARLQIVTDSGRAYLVARAQGCWQLEATYA